LWDGEEEGEKKERKKEIGKKERRKRSPLKKKPTLDFHVAPTLFLPSPRHLPDALMHLLPSLPLLSMHNSAYMYED
jgi:hypothetical protein